MDYPNPLFQGRPGFEERSEALKLLCDGFAKFLGYPGMEISFLTQTPEEIPCDDSRLVVVDMTSQPVVISTYWRFPDPGNPVVYGSYSDLPSFVRGFFHYEIERAARRSSITIPGFPPAPGADIKDVAERYFQALDAESKAVEEEITALIDTPELQELGRIIWG